MGFFAEGVGGDLGVGVLGEDFLNLGLREGFVDAVGGEEEAVAGSEVDLLVVDLGVLFESEGTGEVGVAFGDSGGVVGGELLEAWGFVRVGLTEAVET